MNRPFRFAKPQRTPSFDGACVELALTAVFRPYLLPCQRYVTTSRSNNWLANGCFARLQASRALASIKLSKPTKFRNRNRFSTNRNHSNQPTETRRIKQKRQASYHTPTRKKTKQASTRLVGLGRPPTCL